MNFKVWARACRTLWNRLSAVAAALILSAGLLAAAQPAAAAVYVSDQLKDLTPETKAAVSNPQPVQVLFEFRTKGAANPQATQFAKEKVLEAIRNTGFFSELSEAPVPSGAILNVVIDNVVDDEALRRATGQGFVTGATFFVAGSNIQENYRATVDYISGPGAAPISRSATHFMIVQMGLINSTPKGVVKVGKMNDAFFVMARQIVTNPLNEIFLDPAVSGAPAPAAAPVEAATPEAPAEAPAEQATEAGEADAAEAPAEEPAAAPQS